jgi:hypothetical protein
MKKKIGFIFFTITVLMNVILLYQPASAQSNESLLTGEIGSCKWWTQDCPDNYKREVCVADGTGNTCTCGDVTREC